MLMPSVAGYGDVLFLPRCRSDTAVEFGGELYTFVDVDRTLQGVSGGDQRRRSLQARGLERGFLFVGHETISSRRHNANEFWSAAGSLSGIRVAQPFTGGKAALRPARCGVRIGAVTRKPDPRQLMAPTDREIERQFVGVTAVEDIGAVTGGPARITGPLVTVN